MSSFFFNDTATTEIYTLSLHDALPIYNRLVGIARTLSEPLYSPVGLLGGHLYLPSRVRRELIATLFFVLQRPARVDRKSTRLNSSHANISYAVFCLKKKH